MIENITFRYFTQTINWSFNIKVSLYYIYLFLILKIIFILPTENKILCCLVTSFIFVNNYFINKFFTFFFLKTCYLLCRLKRMTTRNHNSNCENQSCSFPLSSHGDGLNYDNQMNLSNIIHWINSFEFTRPKKTIVRDFSDASKNFLSLTLSAIKLINDNINSYGR